VPLRGRLVVTAGIGVVLTAAGLLLREGTVLALAIPFLLYCGVLLYIRLAPPAPSLSVRRSLEPERIEEGGRLEVLLAVENRGEAIPMLGLIERPPLGCKATEGRTVSLQSLAAGEAQTLSYALQACRGVHAFPAVQALVWDRWSLSTSTLSIPEESELFAQPRVEIFDTIPIRPRRARAFAGVVKANVGGTGLDFFGCREYVSGDDIRRINWRAFARWNELVINEYEQERIADVTVILDARERVNTRIGEACVFDHAVRAAASLALHFLDQGNYVGLLVYGNYLDWTYPSTGRVQRERILEALARARTADKSVFEDLSNIPARRFPPRSQLILVSPLADEDDVEILGILRAREYQILLVSPNALPSKSTERPSDEAFSLAIRIAQLRRALLLDTLRCIGVVVIDWDISEPLTVPLHGLVKGGWRHKWR